MNDLPALGAVGSGVRSGARGLVNSTLKRSAINAAPSREAAEHLARHPLLDDALERAGTLSRPTIYQGNLPTCGHNCATLILNQHGKAVDVGSLIQSIPLSNRGIHGYDVATLLKQNGLDALSVTRRNVDDLARYTARGESVIVRIQKNDFSHFVVVDGVTMRNGKRVVAVRDPHGIQYFSPVDTFRQSFTGDVIITR